MSKVVKEIVELVPDWFSLDHYAPCEMMGLDGWSSALTIRSILYHLTIQERAESQIPDFEAVLKKAATRVEEGVSQVFDQELSYRRVTDIEQEHRLLLSGSVTPVQLIQLGEVWANISNTVDVLPYVANLLEGDRPQASERAIKYSELIRTPIEMLYKRNGEALVGYLGEDSTVLASVDLSAPDEKLIADFSAFIRNYKDALGLDSPKKMFGKREFAQWHQNRVLAYLDVLIWQQYKKIEATHQQIGLIIFPEDFQISLDDKIRRTVRPLALRLIGNTSVNAIRTQAVGFNARH